MEAIDGGTSTAAAVPPPPGATPGAANPAAGALDRLIDWSARNVFLVARHALLVAGGLYAGTRRRSTRCSTCPTCR